MKDEPLISSHETILLDEECSSPQRILHTPGYHIIADMRECSCPIDTLININYVSRQLERSITKNGLTSLGLRGHVFGKNCGFTIVAPLSESHASFHTYPETMSVHFDIFVCHYRHNNTEKAKAVYEDMLSIFRPKNILLSNLERC